ncbi:MAG: flagellar motor switch protein FliM, partial [Calditrichaeota bacterium]|nr:flagellar motor switch protein FliM [Calditrichota bacterium]
MGKILSQEEIDALLSTVSKESDADGQLDSLTHAQLYDFKHPERISKEQIRTLRTIHDGFARMFATYLSSTLRTLVDVNLLSIDQVTFSEYSLSLSVPNALYMLRMKSLEGKALLEINPQFLLFAVDRLLGGGGDTEVEPREISQIEQNVVVRLMATIIKQLNEVWEQVSPLEASIDRFESDPQFVQIARSSDTIAIVFFDIRVRGTTFTMNLAFPYFTLEPIMNKLSAQSMLALTSAKVSDKGSEIISERLQASKLPLQVILANTDVRIRDFIEFDNDDLLQIEKRIEEPLEIFVGKKLKFFGTPGRVGRHKAVKVIRSITQE